MFCFPKVVVTALFIVLLAAAQSMAAARLLENASGSEKNTGVFDQIQTLFYGFGTVGAAAVITDDLGFRREAIQDHAVTENSPEWLVDSRIGVHGSLSWGARLEAVLQLRLAQNVDDLNDACNLAYLKYKLTPEFSLLAGRIPQGYFYLTDNMDVGYSYIWARPNITMYGDLLKFSFDGISARAHVPAGLGKLEFSAGLGQIETRYYGADKRLVEGEGKPFWVLSLLAILV